VSLHAIKEWYGVRETEGETYLPEGNVQGKWILTRRADGVREARILGLKVPLSFEDAALAKRAPYSGARKSLRR
jgi:hypothetical protein